MIPFVVVTLIVMILMLVITVDVANMQLVNTELRSACDAAARAGAENLRRTSDSTAAVNAAIAAAARNTVGGRPLTLTAQDIVLGSTTQSNTGRWSFNQGGSPTTALRVNANMAQGSTAGSVGLFFGHLAGKSIYEPVQHSIAAHTENDIYLCLDRSHSMCFTLSGVDWAYPSGVPGLPNSLKFPPQAGSRWASLVGATNYFFTTLNAHEPKARVGVITWASTIGTSSYEYAVTGQTSPAVTVESTMTTNYAPLQSTISGRMSQLMLGGTNMGGGLQEAVTRINSEARQFAVKTIILMSDGQWNQGVDPTTVATTARDSGIIIHSIGFLSAGQSASLEACATITGGRYYEASDQAQLEQVFQQLATELPVVLID